MSGLGRPTTLSARSACRVFPSERPVVLILAPVGQSLEDWADTSGRVLDDTLASLLVTWYRVRGSVASRSPHVAGADDGWVVVWLKVEEKDGIPGDGPRDWPTKFPKW